MERLTEKAPKPSVNSQYVKRKGFYTADCIERLGMYEDTGLTPPEIMELKDWDTAKSPDYEGNGWIPVEERLPDDEIPTPKLVTALVPDRKARWDTSETFSVIVDTDVYDPDYTGKWEYYKKNVIAWRPLPEPYRPERSEGE